MTRNPKILSVRMSNGEAYDITVMSTTVSLDEVYKSKANQDTEIDGLKKCIEEMKHCLENIDNQEFRYCMSTEMNSISGIKYEKKTFLKFKDVIDIMFS